MFRAAYRSSSGALTVFAASGLHTRLVTGRSQVWVGTQTWLRPVTTCVCKPEAANTVRAPDDERYAPSKHVEPSMNGGIINSVTRLHLVGYFYWVTHLNIRIFCKVATWRILNSSRLSKDRSAFIFIVKQSMATWIAWPIETLVTVHQWRQSNFRKTCLQQHFTKNTKLWLPCKD